MKCNVKLNVGIFNNTDDLDFLNPKEKPIGEKIALDFERQLLLFADRFKTRRVYVVNWTEDKGFSLDFCSKMFKYEERDIAYSLARHYHANVIFYDFKKLINYPLEYIRQFPSPNRSEAEELWKTFNTCCLCFSEKNQCEDVIFRGKKDRMCKYCLDKLNMCMEKNRRKTRL
jgi:hypothetical protein